jgi:basic membrane protein A and related proteins
MRLSNRRGAIVALATTCSVLAAGCGSSAKTTNASTTTASTAPAVTTAPAASTTPTAAGVKVGLVFDIGGKGDQSFNDSAFVGLQKAESDLGVKGTDLEPDKGGENREQLLRQLAEGGNKLVVGVGFLFADAMTKAAADNPKTNFAIVDGNMQTVPTNVADLRFAEEQGSFLVGAIAALQSKTGNVGFIGGVDTPLIKRFEAGYVAGAKKIKPDVKVQVKYITNPPDFSGFNDPAKGKEIALAMYGGGADVVYAAAGGSGSGMFEAAKEVSGKTGTKVWGIGVDSDQYNTVDPSLKDYVLTSMLKRVDVAVFQTIESEVKGTFKGGPQVFDLKVDGVGYSKTGGFVTGYVAQVDGLKADIIGGKITVPTAP